MPQEKRKRGRRGDKKQKQKRQKTEADQAATVVDNLYIEDYSGQQEPVWQGAGHEEDGGAVTFHGLLTDEEQEYFRRADEMLALDEFASLDGSYSPARHPFMDGEERERDRGLIDIMGTRKETVYSQRVP